MVESVRVSWVCTLIALALAVVPACGGDDDDSAAGGGGKAGGGVSGTTAGSTAAGKSGSGSSTEFDAGQGDDRNDVAPGKICERVATILCAGEAACCDSPDRDFAACKTAMLKTCNNTYMLDTIATDARVDFDAAGASKAFTMLEDRASKCDPSVGSWAVSSEGFATSLNGTLKEGDDCEPKGGAEMASVAELLTSLASCTLASNLACMPSTMGWKCAARGGAGSKCGTDANCTEGLYCENPSGELDGSGTCTDRKAAAANCTDDTQCKSFSCTSGKCSSPDDVQAAYCLD